MIRVGIVEDQVLVRDALAKLLNYSEDIKVVFTAENGEIALKEINNSVIDVLLLDIQMPVMNGVSVIKELNRIKSKLKVLILTTFEDEEYISEAMANGAKGYLLKESGLDEIEKSINQIYLGGVYMDPKVAGIYVNYVNQKEKPKFEIENNLIPLSDRELDVVNAVAEGLNNKEIAKKLFLSEGTVKNHITHALNKLNLRDRTQLAIYAIKRGL